MSIVNPNQGGGIGNKLQEISQEKQSSVKQNIASAQPNAPLRMLIRETLLGQLPRGVAPVIAAKPEIAPGSVEPGGLNRTAGIVGASSAVGGPGQGPMVPGTPGIEGAGVAPLSQEEQAQIEARSAAAKANTGQPSGNQGQPAAANEAGAKALADQIVRNEAVLGASTANEAAINQSSANRSGAMSEADRAVQDFQNLQNNSVNSGEKKLYGTLANMLLSFLYGRQNLTPRF